MINIRDVSGDIEVTNKKTAQKRKVHGNCILKVDEEFNISIKAIGNSRAVVLVVDDKDNSKKKTFTLGPNGVIGISNDGSVTHRERSNIKWAIGKLWAYVAPEGDYEGSNAAVGVRG